MQIQLCKSNMFKKRSVKQGAGSKRKKIGAGVVDSVSKDAEYGAMPELKNKPLMGLMTGATSNEATKKLRKVHKFDAESIKSKFTLCVDQETIDDRPTQSVAGSNTQAKLVLPPENVRTTMLTDFQPDVCKDFKQTGYCGYGDSCKFLHSRDDFKTGWKLNQEWKVDDSTLLDGKVENANIPFKCIICKNDYKTPIVTNCGHYFCSGCFTKRVRTESACPICGQETHGVAKIAKNLKSVLKKQDQPLQDM